MRQFVMLFDATYALKFSSIGRQIIVVAPDQQQGSSNSSCSIQQNEIKQNKQRQRYMLNFNHVATAVILFPSVCFTMKQLHRSTVIHNNSSGGLSKEVLQQLVASDVLILCARGIKHSSRSTSVYIKRIPFENDNDAEQNLLVLSEYSFDNKAITMEMYRKSCELISLEAIGIVQKDVYDLLRRPEYGNRDLLVLTLLPKTVASKSTGSVFSLSENDGESICMDIDIDRNLFDDYQQEIGGTMMTHSTQQLTHENNVQQKDRQFSSSVLRVDSASTTEDISHKNTEKAQLSDEESLTDIFNHSDIIEKDTEEEQASVKVPHNINRLDEYTSRISSERRNDDFNDGFVSPTAWQTQSRVKELTETEKYRNSVVLNKLGSTDARLSEIVTEDQENASITNFSPIPPARRTRAQLKRKAKDLSGKSKKIGISRKTSSTNRSNASDISRKYAHW
ncbi:unnamed protein product [Rotaria sordida]|uniref:Uncharacterized protein n=1 Tax=Rotaria sordida TaxID=392033 RepID=A0A814QFD3_9BILA|nr:unnamed protein product [Rotaria sordida]CAF1333635.1 unnamed protein product [Rotaria sordida]